MTAEFDSLVDTRKVATNFASKILDRIYDAAEAKVRAAWAKRKNEQLSDLATLIETQIHNYKMVKNILYYNEPVDLLTLYVPLRFSKERRSSKTEPEVPDQDILNGIMQAKRIVISATAGAGKSFFMRYALLQLSKRDGLVPIFFELRNVNGRPNTTLIEAIIDRVRLAAPSIMPEQISLGMESGAFGLLLDGFDEIEPDKIDHYQVEILKAAQKYQKAPIIVSTRPMDIVLSWQHFEVFHICSLSQDEAVELVTRLTFDETIKAKFIEAMKQDLYARHESFMAVPLLVTMMLVTFSEMAEIDTKLTRFYGDAFNALLVRHDAKKEAFRRQLVSGLSRDEFSHLFATFCMLSYSDSKYQFTEEELMETVGKACDVQDISTKSNLIIDDLCVTSCMLVKDGRFHVFSHRSFQEYFTAVFISSCSEDVALKLLTRVSTRANRDKVLPLLLELNPELVERQWVLPRLRQINLRINTLPADDIRAEFIKAFMHVMLGPEPGDEGDARTIFWFDAKGNMGHNLFVIANLYNMEVFEFIDQTVIDNVQSIVDTARRSSKKSKDIPLAYGVRLGRGKRPWDLLKHLEQLRRIQRRIETSYSRRRLKLEALLK